MSADPKNGTAKPRSPEEQMHLLERRKNVVRSRLLRAIDALDARKHQVETLGVRAKAIAIPTAIAAGAVIALLGASAFSFHLALARRRKRSLRFRLVEAVRGLDLVPKPSLGSRVLEKSMTTVVTLLATEIGKAVSKNFLDGRAPDGRLAVGEALRGHRAAGTPV